MGRSPSPSPSRSSHKKTPPKRGSLWLNSLADLRGIAKGNREEEGCNRKRENEDVSKAFHLKTPFFRGRSVERGSCWRHVALRQPPCGFVAKFGEQAEFNLVSEIGVDAGEHVPVEGAGSVPNVAEEEQQRKSGVTEGEPSAG